jgi:putative sigma-54 modulation protein
MELEIISKHLEDREAVESYVDKKIGKLSRYLPNIDEGKVEIREEKTKSSQNRFTVQVTLNSKGKLLRGEERGDSVYAAVDAVYEVMSRQIERFKGKRYRKGRSVPSRPVLVEETEAVPEVVRVKRLVARTMSVEDAAEQMELLGHDFFLFVNDDNKALSLLYRRDDGDYGLIEPELG